MKPWGIWKPDAYGLNSEFAAEALNVLPGSASWKPWPLLVTQSAALATACRGAFIARDPSTGAISIFAGTATALWLFVDAVSAWTDVSRAAPYSLTDGEFWQFRQFGAIVIAVAGGNNPQAYTLGSSTDFADLAGSPPQAKYIEIVGDFVVLGDINSPSNGRSGIIWSGLNDATHWTVGQKFCDRQIFPDGGFVAALTALETGMIIQNEAVRRFARTPDRSVFNFAKIEAMQGTRSPYSIIQHKGIVFYRGVDGFIASSAGALSGETGVDWIDDWFDAEANLTRLSMIVGTLDPKRPALTWIFPSAGNTSTTLDRAIRYDIALERWCHAEFNAEFIFGGATAGTTTDVDTSILDDFPLNLVDSPLGLGGVPNLAAFDGAHKLAFFTGQAMAATLRTCVFEPIPGRRFYVNGHRSIGDSQVTQGRVLVCERPPTASTQMTQKPLHTVNAQGRIPTRASGRYLQIEEIEPEGGTWADKQGVDFDQGDIVPDGQR